MDDLRFLIRDELKKDKDKESGSKSIIVKIENFNNYDTDKDARRIAEIVGKILRSEADGLEVF